MILPYASDNLPERRPLATLLLLAVTFTLSLVILLSEWTGNETGVAQTLAFFGIVPNRFQPLTLLTYPLFHASLGHLLVNAFYLWAFGAGIEAAVGRKKFVLLFFAGGVVGGLLQWLVTLLLLPVERQGVPLIGASAACAALIGLYAARYYRTSLHFVGLPLRAHVVLVVTLFLCYEIGAGLYDVTAGNASDGVAHWAHIGGFIFGLACASWMRLTEAGERAYLTADASQAMNKSVPGAAIKKWEVLLAREPSNVQARRELARAWLLMGDREQAQQEYAQGIRLNFAQQQPLDAAALYSEACEAGLPLSGLEAAQSFALGRALEDLELFALAADVLQTTALQNADAPQSENALLRAVSITIHRLNRREEADVLLRQFEERYPKTVYRALADELRRSLS